MSQILDGKAVGRAVKAKVKEEAVRLKMKGVTPKLVILRVGDSKASMAYEKAAMKVMKSVEIEVETRTLKEESSTAEVLAAIDDLNNDPNVHGVIMMQPLPQHISRKDVSSRLDPRKDVDALNPINLGLLMEGDPKAMAPSTAQAVMEILDYYAYDLKGADVCVIGSSPVVGKPLVNMLLNRFATVSNCHIYTKDNRLYSTKADIVISATGALGLVGADYIKEGATVIDVGYGFKDGVACGDVRYDEVAPKAGAITPVPGGVGSVTTAVLAVHTIKAVKLLYPELEEEK
ncbi:bifunctional 5,10-methylenetetrahydrofolate dehydrogenase/5,10-methenyltetrahydrofolate cyclohydrolase [Atopobacter sp. AH10]|uniref:bifunctional 5,10-methylenetetrahydrofolate dehydrogenase/5,10-methenyltetrahydrofolate cyclohydrolase n=1 Tax=Atopobacter sp. AH10 TaxID=2315861 RepID=UPI000EF1BFEC|nr:bifunctional 5,10-methylenetetrahydrofolate dehydrogenase/5,10-methenyltetrahydrofolate cyclohydrolase [Atopobacter sp. AH10]RLK63365.1 bifunctional 5,10-methylenetetrahydrofolate dehydrogenase/5,10-methenyltetrahydrofolate cyclohydrolase [Atopobacter sp. AH10]